RSVLLAAAAGGLDLRARRAAELVGDDRQRPRQLTVTEHLDQRAAADQTPLGHALGRHLTLEPLELVQVDHRVAGLEDVGEPALRHAADERHLPALEAGETRVARPRLLALVALAGGL